MDRQRLLTIFGIAWVSAAVLTWFLYAKTKAPRTEKTVRIVAASREMAAGTKLGKGDLRIISAIERDLPKGAITEAKDVLGKALLYPVGTNEPITAVRLSTLGGAEGISATIEPGMRAMSVAFTDATGVSGLIQPRSHVDVLYTRTGNSSEALTATILEDIVVLSIGRNTEVQPTVTNTKATTVTRSQNQTATLMVTPDQAKKLELAKNQGKLSLALRNPLDRSTQPTVAPATLESIDPSLGSRTVRRAGAMPSSLKDAQAWAKLVADGEAKAEKKKEPPPKPKHVVDVFRGEKHVQEIFQ
jgi:pilus assembly protein CpaB